MHRSPPIESTGETRLVLVLDPVTDPENEILNKLPGKAACIIGAGVVHNFR
ncbi:MAG: DUF1826 domain-containing protein [Roseobacter sp.]